MRIEIVITAIVISAAVTSLSGCKKEEAAAPAQTETPKPSEAMTQEASKVVDTVTTTAKQVTDQAPTQAKQVTDQATTQANAVEQQAQGLIEKAKGYIADKKYQEALTTINQLSSSKLTADQQKLVDTLKAQIQSALGKATASDAASALGGAIGK